MSKTKSLAINIELSKSILPTSLALGNYKEVFETLFFYSKIKQNLNLLVQLAMVINRAARNLLVCLAILKRGGQYINNF